MTRPLALALFLLTSLMMLLTASSPAAARVRVVTTTATLAAIAREVGGADADVDALAAPTEDPHFVEAKPSLIVKLNQADVLVLNGLDLEIGWLPRLQVQARNAKVAPGGAGVVDASAVVALLDVPTGKLDRAMGDVHPGGNPHFLLDPRRAASVALAIAEKMAAADGAVADAVRARAKDAAARWSALADEERKRALALPAERRRVVAYHRSLTYLADWLALEEVATIEPKPGIPPDPGHVALVLQTIKQKRARALLQEEFYPKATSKTLSSLTSAPLVVIPGGPRANESYADHVRKIADEVLHALGT